MNSSRYCENQELIENYEKAKADNFVGQHCHHRLETHTSDGERILVDITMKELKALNMYYHRPLEELIFMRIKDHHRLHSKCKHFSEDRKKKLSESNKGKLRSNETRNRLSESHKGRRWFNNGEISIMCFECPEGFVPGRLKNKDN